MLRAIGLHGALLGALPGCASRRVQHLETQVLEQENVQLRQQLATCQETAPPSGTYAPVVTADVVASYLARAGFPNATRTPQGVFLVPVDGANTTFRITIQHFDREKVLFIAASEYLKLEEASSSKNMVLLLTQLAALNFDLLLGKFQLNPSTGDISLSVELNLDDGLGFRTFDTVLHHLIKTADEQYPVLQRVTGGGGI